MNKGFKKIFKKVLAGVAIFAAVFMAVWFILPTRGAEAGFKKQKSRVSAGYLRDLSVALWTRLAIIIKNNPN